MNRIRMALFIALGIFVILSYEWEGTTEQQNCMNESQVELTPAVPLSNPE